MKALCVNCIEYTDCGLIAVGADKGAQRDPYRDTLTLCSPCGGALQDGDLVTFHERYVTAREVSRDEVTPRG